MYSDKVSKTLQRARSFIQSGNPRQALFDLEKAVKKYPMGFEAWFLLGHAKGLLNEHAAAENCFKKAAVIQPSNPDVWFNLGLGYFSQGKHKEAIPCFQKAIDNAYQRKFEAGFNLGSCLLALDKFSEAAQLFQELLGIRESQDVFANLGIALQGMENHSQAIKSYQRAIEMGMDSYTINLNIGTCYFTLNDFQQSIRYSQKALALKPGDPVAEYNIARGQLEQGDISSAVDALQKCTLPAAVHARLFALNFVEPYDPAMLLEAHRNWAEQLVPDIQLKVTTRIKSSNKTPLRLGFVSADLRRHPVAFFLEQLIAHIDREHFSVHFFSDVRTPDDITERFKKLADHWIDIASIADTGDAINLISGQEIDILFDLGGHTSDRVSMFAHRIAPVQATYLGYGATTGLSEMDYFITDEILDPVGLTENHYTEQLCRLGRSFATYTPPVNGIEIGSLPMLNRGYPVFGSFHKLNKISNRTIRLWSETLSTVPQAKMMIFAKGLDTESVRNHLTEQFGTLGIPSSRLELRGNISMEEYFAVHNEIDLLLDCFPWNSHTTAMHGLWMGVPTLTVAGDHHTGRFGEMILNALNLGDFIAANDEEFSRKAAQFISDHARLQTVRKFARAWLAESVLCDHSGLAAKFQLACRQMWICKLEGKTESINI